MSSSQNQQALSVRPAFIGEARAVSDLEDVYGPVERMVLGYGENEIAEDGRFDWPAAVLPHGFMRNRLSERRAAGLNGPFLMAMGSLKGLAQRGGIGNALHGVALAADTTLSAEQLLPPHHLTRPRNLNDRGEFRWPTGVPLLRVWLCDPPIPFVDVTGFEPTFNQSQGKDMQEIERLVPGLSAGIKAIMVREVELLRPTPLPDSLTKKMEWLEGERRWRAVGAWERDPRARKEALDRQLRRDGRFHCELCPYEPGTDRDVPAGGQRSMMDVHHRNAPAIGPTMTKLDDLMVLCPTCHRRWHVRERLAEKMGGR